MKHVITCTAAALALAGCSQKPAAEEAVRQNLRDPDSARFGDFYYNPQTKKGCLAVNAKNTMGGYSGFQLAHLQKSDSGWEAVSLEDEDWDACHQYADKA